MGISGSLIIYTNIFSMNIDETKHKVFAEHVNVEFSTPEDVGPRNWGREILVALIPGVATGKVLMMNKGAKGGLQYHQLKNEAAYLYAGEMIFRYDEGDGILKERVLKAGDSVRIPPGAVHQEEAVTDCIIFEISSPVFNDRVRMEPAYGKEIPEGGLPSVPLTEVQVK